MKRVLICGSRTWHSYAMIKARVEQLPEGCIVIEGGASGADEMAEDAARETGHHSAQVLPNWQCYGNRAGYLRNCAMLDLQPDLVIAFTQGTNGTQLTIDEARKRGIPVEIHGWEAAK